MKPDTCAQRCSSYGGARVAVGQGVDLRDACGLTRTRKGMITIRWALWFSLLLVMVFAVSIGYHLGMQYAEQFIGR